MTTYAGVTSIFEVRSGATAGNVNGGGFNPANANFISNFTATSATGNSPVIASASYNFVAGDVNAWIYVKSGSNWTAGFYQIASVASNKATVNAAIGQAIQISNGRYITNTVAGCATTASPTSGTCGIDYSQQTAAQYVTTVLTGTTTACTNATNPFTTSMVGNFVNMNSGTGVTAGWYEIVSVSASTATLDRSAGTSYSSVVAKIGGAVSLGGSTTGITDIIFFALGTAGGAAATGNRWFIKGNGGASYTINGAVIANSGQGWPVIIEGYNLLRGDRPAIASGNQPIFSMGANIFTGAQYTWYFNITFTGTASSVFLAGVGENFCFNCKFKNTSTAAAQNACNLSLPYCAAINCEMISYNGTALNGNSSNPEFFVGNYIHDSNIGISGGGGGSAFINNIISGCTTEAILCGGSVYIIYGNTIYGGGTNQGNGISAPAIGLIMNNLFNNLLDVYAGGTTLQCISADYNGYYNYTALLAASTTVLSGANDVTINSNLSGTTNVAGTTATNSGTTFTDTGKNFTTLGVVAGRDYLHVLSGTGATVGIYGITAVGTTTLTTDNGAGTISSGGTYFINKGANYAAGTAMNGIGFPQVFGAGLTAGSPQIGAVAIAATTPILQSGIIKGLGII